MHTDTERLDWLLGKTGADRDYTWQDKTYTIRWFHESRWYIVRGPSWRDCIDAALDGKAEVVN